MAQTNHCNRYNYDEVTIATAADIEFIFTNTATADTATKRYIEIGSSGYSGAQGIKITAISQDMALIEVNEKLLKSQRSIPAAGSITIRRGDWQQIKISTTETDTTIGVEVVA